MTSWSNGEVTLTMRLSWTCSVRRQPTPQYGQTVSVRVWRASSQRAACAEVELGPADERARRADGDAVAAVDARRIRKRRLVLRGDPRAEPAAGDRDRERVLPLEPARLDALVAEDALRVVADVGLVVELGRRRDGPSAGEPLRLAAVPLAGRPGGSAPSTRRPRSRGTRGRASASAARDRCRSGCACPASTRRWQAGTRTRAPSSSTTHTRQAFCGIRVWPQQSVGVSMPRRSHAPRMVVARATLTSRPSIVSATASLIGGPELAEPGLDHAGGGLPESADGGVAHRRGRPRRGARRRPRRPRAARGARPGAACRSGRARTGRRTRGRRTRRRAGWRPGCRRSRRGRRSRPSPPWRREGGGLRRSAGGPDPPAPSMVAAAPPHWIALQLVAAPARRRPGRAARGAGCRRGSRRRRAARRGPTPRRAWCRASPRVPSARNASAPSARITGTHASVSTLLITVGRPKRP